MTSTYGGGLVSGDEIALRVQAGNGTRVVLTTQASTKIYRGQDGGTSAQRVDVTVGDDAILACVPDPVTCFAGARCEQVQRFVLTESSSLLALDWLTSGRWACGERWAFDRCRTRWDISIDGRTVFADAMLLDPAHGPLASPHRLGRFDCLATAVLIGPAFADVAAEVLRSIGKQPIARDAETILSASPLPGGVVLRVAGPGAEAVGQVLRDHLSASANAIGDDPWARK